MTLARHFVRNVDDNTRTGDCSVCGPGAAVVLYRTSSGPWGCRTARRAADSKRDRSSRNRHAHRLRRFSLTEEEHAVMLADQAGVCAICEQPCPRGVLAVDHDHETGRVRGLLCNRCNRAIGLLGDTADGVRRALEYLSQS